MKMLKNLKTAKPNLSTTPMTTAIGAQMRRARPRQSVPRGWIGSYSRSMSAIVPSAPSSNAAALLRQALTAFPDPFLAALVHLLLPERHLFLQRVDRVLAGGQRVLAVRCGHGDDDGRLTDLHPARAVVDRDLAHVVALLQRGRDLRHHLLGHAFVRLVVEVLHHAAARFVARRADER